MNHTNDEQLLILIKNTKSVNEFIRKLFGKTDGNSWRKGKNIIERLGADVSHYRTPKYTKEILAPLVEKSKSTSEVCRKLGLKKGGGSQAFIKRKIKEFQIDYSHFEKPKFKVRDKKTWEEVLVKRNEGNRTAPYILRRALKESGRKYSCEAEGCKVKTKWLGKPIVLQAHHIDGNCLNDESNNLLLVCPNCHTQTANWCNKGKRNK